MYPWSRRKSPWIGDGIGGQYENRNYTDRYINGLSSSICISFALAFASIVLARITYYTRHADLCRASKTSMPSHDKTCSRDSFWMNAALYDLPTPSLLPNCSPSYPSWLDIRSQKRAAAATREIVQILSHQKTAKRKQASAMTSMFSQNRI